MAKGKSAYQQFLAKRMPELSAQGIGGKGAMRQVAEEWNAQKNDSNANNGARMSNRGGSGVSPRVGAGGDLEGESFAFPGSVGGSVVPPEFSGGGPESSGGCPDEKNEDLIELITDLTVQLDEQQQQPSHELTELDHIDDQICVLEDEEKVDEHKLYFAVIDEVEEADPSIRNRMFGHQGLSEADLERMRSLRPTALERCRAERERLLAEQTDRPGAWDLVANIHLHPGLFDWFLAEVRKRRRGLPGAPGSSIRTRTLGRALQTAVSRHKATEAA